MTAEIQFRNRQEPSKKRAREMQQDSGRGEQNILTLSKMYENT